MGGDYCHVIVLVRMYLHIRDNSAKEDDIISSLWDHVGKLNVTDNNIHVAIRRAVITLQLSNKGIIPDRVGYHSLRAGGAIALKFAGADRDDIKNMGRWSSDTFLVYIHDQIAEYSERWTKKMSVPRSFFNLEGGFT